jgi:Zn-finger nucleic acid-binding protein
VHLFDDAELVECSNSKACGGIWCPREAFERLRHNALHSSVPAGPAPDAVEIRASEPSADRFYVPCLACGNLMQRRQFRHADRPSGIVIDVCKDHGMWFDRNELQAVLAFVRRQRDTGIGATPARLPSAPKPGGDGQYRTYEEATSRPPRSAKDFLDDVLDAAASVFSFSLFD